MCFITASSLVRDDKYSPYETKQLHGGVGDVLGLMMYDALTSPPARRHGCRRLSFLNSTPSHHPIMEQYMIALYKGGNALTNLGYETVRPVNAPEILLCILVMFMQVFPDGLHSW